MIILRTKNYSGRKGEKIPEWSKKFKIDDFEYTRLKEFYKDKPKLAQRDGWNGYGFNNTQPLIKSYSAVKVGDIVSIAGSKIKVTPQNISNVKFLNPSRIAKERAMVSARAEAQKKAPWLIRKLGLFSEPREKVPDNILNESWKTGVVQKDEKGQWRIISRQKGEYWNQVYSSKEKAEAALKAYQARKRG